MEFHSLEFPTNRQRLSRRYDRHAAQYLQTARGLLPTQSLIYAPRHSPIPYGVTESPVSQRKYSGFHFITFLFLCTCCCSVHGQNNSTTAPVAAPVAAPVSTMAPVPVPTAPPTTPPTGAPTTPLPTSPIPTTPQPTQLPTHSSAPSATASVSPTALASFDTEIVEKEHFRQEFFKREQGAFFNETEVVLLQEVYENYTEIFNPEPEKFDRITTDCEVTDQKGDVDASTNKDINSVDFLCTWTSRHVNVTGFPELFLEEVNRNLPLLLKMMTDAGAQIDDVEGANPVRILTVLSPAPSVSSKPSAMPSGAPSISPPPSAGPSGLPSFSPTEFPTQPTTPILPTNPPVSSPVPSDDKFSAGAISAVVVVFGLACFAGIAFFFRRSIKRREEQVGSPNSNNNRVWGQESAGPNLPDDDTDQNVMLSPSESIKSNRSLVSDGREVAEEESLDEADGTNHLQDEFDQYKDQNLEQLRMEIENNVTNLEALVSAAVTNAIIDNKSVDTSELLWGCAANPSGAEIEASALYEVTDWLKKSGNADGERKRAFMQKILNRTLTSVRYGVLGADDASRIVHESAAILGLPLSEDLPGTTVIISGMQKTTTAADMEMALAEFGEVECSAVAPDRRGFGLLRYKRPGSASRAFQRYTSGEIVILEVAIQMKVLNRGGVLDDR